MTRNIVVTAVDGNTGFVIAELLLTNKTFSSKIHSVIGLSLSPKSQRARDIEELGAKVHPHKHGRERDMVKLLKESGADTICVIPPAHSEKYDITVELVTAARKANVPNVLFLSSVGADLAERKKQPHLREFVDLETLVLTQKGDPATSTGHSPCIIRAGFYAENLLLYAPQAKEEGVLPLPIGKDHKFAPVALGVSPVHQQEKLRRLTMHQDVAELAAHVLSGKGKHGFDDKHRGQLMVFTGPMLVTGSELATAASQALGVELEFQEISEAEAKKVLKSQSDIDHSEQQYLLEYYRLVREGKTNYIATTAFVNVTGSHPTEPTDVFRLYSGGPLPEPAKKRRKSQQNGR